jgi:hypothetical protein
MSYLNSNNSEFLSARITNKGRKSISQGNFVISYFQIGDSEFDYNDPFSAYTGLQLKPHQMVLSPFDYESGVKYPYKIDSSDTSTTFGVPIQNSSTVTIRNIMGPAGFVSNYIPYDGSNCTGTTIGCVVDRINFTQLNGSNHIVVSSGCTFENCEYITLVLDQFCGTTPVITGQSTSLIYQLVDIITGTTGTTLYLDRSTPKLSGLTGYAEVVCNNCENEFPNQSQISPVCFPNPIDTTQQLNPWKMNVVWGEKPIGFDVDGLDENLSGFTSNVYVSSKELLGYTTSTGQTFEDYTGGTIDNPTSYLNSFDEIIIVASEAQRCIAIIHYSELGDIINDPERFFKYDDYISHCTNTGSTGDCPSIIQDENDVPLSDTQYFEVYIPFIYYHRNTGTTVGAIFRMDDTDYYMKSVINPYHSLLFRYLIDEQGNKVGKVFVNNKIIVFDDQELVAILDYRSNRKYTLPAPKISVTPSDSSINDSLITGGTGQTIWVTYMFAYTNDPQLNGLPCNYYSSVSLDSTLDSTCSLKVPSQVTFKISGSTIPNMNKYFSGATSGFIANKFYILAQETLTGQYPEHTAWKLMDYTIEASGNSINLLDPLKIINKTFTITKSKYTGGTSFDLENFLSNNQTLPSNYIPNEPSTDPQFGDEQPFPGSVRLIRATDIEQLNFLVNLPSSQFMETQNPTYSNGVSKRITEIALLNENKEPLVVSKTPTPIERIGTQVFAVRLDF